MSLVIWHNPRCSKSRQTLALLQDAGHEPALRLYLNDPPTLEEIQAVWRMLGPRSNALVRQKEALFKELGLSPTDSPEQLMQAMAAHPQLIERPVVIHDDRAALGRPPEDVLKIV